MKRFSPRYLRYFIYILVFTLLPFLTLVTSYAQEFDTRPGPKAKLTKKAIRFNRNHPRIRAAIRAQEWHTPDLFDIPGVIGTAVGVSKDQPTIRVYATKARLPWIPKSLDGFPVEVKVTGKIVALQGVDPTAKFAPPVPIGVSTGHPNITAGTIGCRVTDGTNVYALSNNHVYANENYADIGDNVLQPGAFDGGVEPDDAIGTLFDFQPITFCFWWPFLCENNQIDAAIALSSTTMLGKATPIDGYGLPKPTIVAPVVGQSVMKYGRTTSQTTGTVTAINATIDVGYSSGTARFVNQLTVENGTPVIGPGDSGSLLVTNPGRNPVGLVFAGNESGTFAVANRIDLVLDHFEVSIDGEVEQPITDVAISSVSAPASVVLCDIDIVDVEVTVENTGNQDVPDSFDVTLEDLTDSTQIGDPQTVPGLAAGASTTLTYSWDTTDASIGTHTLEATHNLSDENDTNDADTAVVEVTESEPPGGPYLQTGKAWATTAGWTTVDLGHDYGNDMVVICTPNYEYDPWLLPEPLVAHVRNANGSSFQVKLVQAVGSSIQDVSADVHYMVVEEGVYTLAEHGVKMEAVKFNSTITDGSGSWVGQNRSYTNSYTNPVVVGQVMSYNADRAWYWSVFWGRGSSRTSPPSSTALWVGKHKAQDPRAVNNETLGYVVIEAGEGTMDTPSGTARYFAALDSDTVRGIYNTPPYTYSLSSLSFTPSTAILSQAAMDGGDGGWAVLYGSNPVTSSSLKLVIEEDMVWDSERRHTTEQVGYIVFE